MVAETHFGRDGSVVKASSSAECTLTSQMHHIANMLFDIQNSDPEVLKQDCKSLENAMHECQNVANNVCKEFSKWKQMAREIETRATAKYGQYGCLLCKHAYVLSVVQGGRKLQHMKSRGSWKRLQHNRKATHGNENLSQSNCNGLMKSLIKQQNNTIRRSSQTVVGAHSASCCSAKSH